eukprot:SM000129S26127  [mRNA]  locus=s129:86932:88652:+ [translate_table: standard]
MKARGRTSRAGQLPGAVHADQASGGCIGGRRSLEAACQIRTLMKLVKWDGDKSGAAQCCQGMQSASSGNCFPKEKEETETRQRWGHALQVVNVSSITHRYVDIPDANKFLHDFASGLYAQCKLANVLFTNELHRRWRGRNIEAFAVDPGAVLSDIWRNSKFSRPPWKWLAQSTFSPTWDGAIPVIHAAMGDTSNAASDRKYSAVFFARGTFAWPIFTLPPPGILKYLLPVTGVFYLLDWPLRRLSQGRWLSKVRSVRSSPNSYNVKLAQELWEAAADVAGLPRQ